MLDRGKRNVLGVRVQCVDYEAAVDQIVACAHSGRRFTVTALAVHGVMTGALDPVHRHRLNALDMVVPDGQPVRWALNFLYRVGLADRVYGPSLTLHVCEAAALAGLPIFLFGGTESMLEQLTHKLQDRFPNLCIAGREASRFRRLDEAECDQLVERIRRSGARITLVGIGCPRQEIWAYEMGDALQMPILAVGAAFAFHAGQLSQAPPWMQRSGLEWLYRLICEPRRLWYRYGVLNPLYMAMLALQALGVRRYDPEQTTPPQERMLYG
jgi:exopolysaccharide biosynthesis WecB/TagA/CpsF family protein